MMSGTFLYFIEQIKSVKTASKNIIFSQIDDCF